MDIWIFVLGVFVGWVTMFIVALAIGWKRMEKQRKNAIAEQLKLIESLQKLQQVAVQMGQVRTPPTRGKVQ
jgi:uncharacterized membrane protein (DUF106 family)